MKEEDIQKLDGWTKFEKQFPFYRMDVNGFMSLVRKAARLTYED